MWVSRIWPTFIRLGTPSGLRITSTGVPSSRNGMSSSGTIFAITPLLPWRPASLSPSAILRFFATYTRTSSFTPGDRSSPASRENVLTSMTLPPSPCGTLREVSRTSRHLPQGPARRGRQGHRRQDVLARGGRDLEGGVANLARLLLEDRADQLLLRR